MAARNMQRTEINIQEEIVRQVDHLQGRYQDARSIKHKILIFLVSIIHLAVHMRSVMEKVALVQVSV